MLEQMWWGGEKSNLHANWSNGLFVDLGTHFYIPVADIWDYASPKVGFRTGIGYHFFEDYKNSFLISANSGWSFISGTNPLVRTLDLVPLSFFAEYNFSPIYFLSINAGSGCGVFFSSISRYKTAVDLIQNNMSNENAPLFFVHANLGTSFKLLKNSISLCLDFGIDLIPENDGPIPLPYFCVSTKFYPFKIAKFTKVEKVIEYPKEINSLTRVYFSENSTEIQESYQPILNYLALYLKGITEKNKKDTKKKISIVLTGYSAPFGLENSQDEIAEERARVIMEYIRSRCGLKDDSFIIRIKTSNFDIDGLPLNVTNAHLQKYRLVEINLIKKSDINSNADIKSNTNNPKNTQAEKKQ